MLETDLYEKCGATGVEWTVEDERNIVRGKEED